MPKKVLIITYYFPPAGGPGVQRWLKFVKYLPDFNIQPIVYVPENPTYPLVDKNFEAEIHPDLTIIKQKIFEPYQLASFFSKKRTKRISAGIIPDAKKQTILDKFLLWIRGNVFIPDARKFWIKPSVKFLKKYIEKHKIETIITTGPPHSLHLIGLELKKNNQKINWFADFRDPWTTIGYHKDLKLSAYAQKKHKQLEKNVLQQADCIIVTSPTTKKEFELLTNKPIELITNGYDIEQVKFDGLDKKFTLAHIGSLLSERNPEILWEVLNELTTENQLFAANFELKLAGAISKNVLESLEKYNLSKYVTNLGYISHSEALLAQRKAQVLLLIEINRPETRCIIPGKLFEYMAAERPILAVGPKNADIEQIIIQTNTGIFCNYTEKDKIKTTLIHYFKQYLNKNLLIYAMGLQYYSRKKLTEKLVNILTKCFLFIFTFCNFV